MKEPHKGTLLEIISEYDRLVLLDNYTIYYLLLIITKKQYNKCQDTSHFHLILQPNAKPFLLNQEERKSVAQHRTRKPELMPTTRFKFSFSVLPTRQILEQEQILRDPYQGIGDYTRERMNLRSCD